MDDGQQDCQPSRADQNRLTPDGWQHRYEAGETQWDRGECNPALMQWLESSALQPGCILIPGCGRGHEAVELAKRGFEVTALDFAEAPVQELTRRLTEANLAANVLREDILHFATSEKFDTIYEQTSLCAIDPRHWPAYEQRIANSLRPDGRLFALFMQSGKTDGPPFTCGLEAMRDLFDKSRWNWPNEHFTVEHPAGMTEIAVVLQRTV